MNKPQRNKLIRYLVLAVGILLLLCLSYFYTARSVIQEFIIVRVKDQPNVQAGVLINGERNGTTGVPITLGSPGWVFISVDLPKAREQSVNVIHTTVTHPMNIEIDCD
jgi:hypothetical protein